MLMLGYESEALVTLDLQVRGDSTCPRAHGLHSAVVPRVVLQLSFCVSMCHVIRFVLCDH